uniref:Secreted protein n=1 Tax=Caenorhabditis japonica TaxID=281687 RepID=A0A8R1IEU6_CAEJA
MGDRLSRGIMCSRHELLLLLLLPATGLCPLPSRPFPTEPFGVYSNGQRGGNGEKAATEEDEDRGPRMTSLDVAMCIYAPLSLSLSPSV